jgi:hypothetical protein
MDPARIFTESLTPRPELENNQGQTRPSSAIDAMSPLPDSCRDAAASQTAETCQQETYAVQQIAFYSNQLVGAGGHCRRHFQTERPGGLRFDPVGVAPL